MAYQPVMTSVGYLVRDDRVLLVHRTARSNDDQYGYYNGLGGKLEPQEDPASCVIREVREESGLIINSVNLRGTVNWPGFGKSNTDVFGFIFRIDDFTGEPTLSNEEGNLGWHPIASIMDLTILEGDRYFLPLVFDDDPRIFHAVIPYQGYQPTGCTLVR